MINLQSKNSTNLRQNKKESFSLIAHLNQVNLRKAHPVFTFLEVFIKIIQTGIYIKINNCIYIIFQTIQRIQIFKLD